jgi:hypothetical protein
VRDTAIGEVGNNIFGLKVLRHCPLVLLIGVRLEFRINSTFYFFIYNVIGVGCIETKFSPTLGGLH